MQGAERHPPELHLPHFTYNEDLSAAREHRVPDPKQEHSTTTYTPFDSSAFFLVMVVIGDLQLFKPLASQEVIGKESSQDESVGYDEKLATDGSEFGESRPPEVLSQLGHAVRHTCFRLVYSNNNRRVVHFSQMAAEQRNSSNLSPRSHLRDSLILSRHPR